MDLYLEYISAIETINLSTFDFMISIFKCGGFLKKYGNDESSKLKTTFNYQPHSSEIIPNLHLKNIKLRNQNF